MQRSLRIIVVASLLSAIGLLGYFSFHKRNKYEAAQLQNSDNIVPVLIIGSGPAGLSAAIYCARAKYFTVVLGGEFGGQLGGVKYIENWPAHKPSTGLEIMEELKEQASNFGAHILDEKAVEIDLSQWPFVVRTDNEKTLRACAIILATGGTARKLEVPGVEEFWGKGVGSCTTCEAPLYKDKEVSVVGGGDTAADRALELAAHAKVVYMLVREDKLDAVETVQDYLTKTPNIRILYNTALEHVDGNDEWVTSIKVKDVKTSESRTLPASGIYFAIGYHPNSDLVKKSLNVDSEGFIVVKGVSQETSKTGVYAAGNVAISDKLYGKAGVATGSGIKAALDALELFTSNGLTPQAFSSLEKNFLPIVKQPSDKSATHSGQ